MSPAKLPLPKALCPPLPPAIVAPKVAIALPIRCPDHCPQPLSPPKLPLPPTLPPALPPAIAEFSCASMRGTRFLSTYSHLLTTVSNIRCFFDDFFTCFRGLLRTPDRFLMLISLKNVYVLGSSIFLLGGKWLIGSQICGPKHFAPRFRPPIQISAPDFAPNGKWWIRSQIRGSKNFARRFRPPIPI